LFLLNRHACKGIAPMSTLLHRIGVEVPIVQAGMGGGAAGHRLAVAVSEAGGLGTIGFGAAEWMRDELARARSLTRCPLSVNLLLPFARAAHWAMAAQADVVVTFWGAPRRRGGRVWIHQCGSVREAQDARAAGADAVIVQGIEAGGHVRGTIPALELLERVRAALPAGYPVWLAGGIAERGDVREAIAAGADAAVLGTRFLLSEESPAHGGYKQRLLDADETLLTELFGAGWPAPHRVVTNAATERWAAGERRGPGWVRALNGATAPVLSRIPASRVVAMAAAQRPGVPFFGPALPLEGQPNSVVDATALYAGESVARIADIRPAAELVGALAP
jgi:NAD(P)H-dependent flavin oxidoreductase YrpB (nitropropane dioxygenase family)